MPKLSFSLLAKTHLIVLRSLSFSRVASSSKPSVVIE